ncbi:hypothetical protein CGRA01v4_03283 [Colletotrichum graminicola]|nr:hypothetical protein CGRA01v4_03283 [Colletotrichum graminicola]
MPSCNASARTVVGCSSRSWKTIKELSAWSRSSNHTLFPPQTAHHRLAVVFFLSALTEETM